MAIIGFIVCLLFVLWMTFTWFILAAWPGTSSSSEKLGMGLGALFISWIWYLVISYAPFTVVTT